MILKDLDSKIRSLKGKLKSEKAIILYLVFYLLSYSLNTKGTCDIGQITQNLTGKGLG